MSSPTPDPEPAHTNPELVEELVFACLESGDPRTAVDEAAAEHPELAGDLRDVFALLERQGLVGKRADVDADEIPERLGQFRLERRLGAGGMGIVFAAEDEALGRSVAVKLIRPEQTFFPGARERFQREVETIARLQHPGIVPVYEVGRHGSLPYFAMERVIGCSLAEAIAELRRAGVEPTGRALAEAVAGHAGTAEAADSPSDTGTRLADQSWPQVCIDLVSQVASALHHAHERGILHRDVKPSNVLVTSDGRARVVDFGLAWTDQADQRLTQTTSQLGSLPYLPPECVSGKLPDPSRRVDVYSLGVTLYELLTLRNPFLASTPAETRRRILDAHPTPPRRLERSVSHELETVCLVAMDPDPAERYATAAEMLRDLEHVRDHEPIEARRPSLALRARRWTQRHATLSVALAVGLILAAIGFFVFGFTQRAARLEADRLRRLAQQERYSALLSAASVELGAGLRPSVARQMLAQCRAEHRGWEWRYLEFASDESAAKVTGLEAGVESVSWSPDGERFVTTSQAGALAFWRADGTPIRSVAGENVARAVFRPHAAGRELVTGSRAGALHLRDGVTGAVRAAFLTEDAKTGEDHALGGQVVTIAFAPDGRRMFTTSADGRVVAWDVERRTWLADLGKHGLRAHSLDVSRDGRVLASGGYDSAIHLYDLATLRRTRTLRLLPKGRRGMPRFVMDLQFTADGKRLFVADAGALKVFDLESGAEQAEVRDRQAHHAMALALSPDGNLLAAVLGQRALHLYRLDERGRSRRVKRLLGHEGLVTSVAFHPGGKRIASGGSQPVARVWDTTYAAEGMLRAHRRYVGAVASTERNIAFSTDLGGALSRVLLASGIVTRLQTADAARVIRLVATPAGCYSVDVDGRVRLWSAEATEPRHEFATVAGVTAADVGGEVAVVATREGDVSVFTLADGTLRRTWHAHDGFVHRIAIGAGGESFWTAAADGTLRQWSTDTGELERELDRHPAWISELVVAAGAGWIATACADTCVRVFDAGTGELRHVLRGHGRAPLALAVMPGGERLVSSGGYDNEIRIWDPETGRCLLSLVVRPAVTALAVSPDGELLLSGTSLGGVEWRQSRPGEPRKIETRRAAAVDTITSRPGGDHR